jgi:hypothetical protein
MLIFTFIVSFEKGIYISQNYAENINSAVGIWAQEPHVEMIDGLNISEDCIFSDLITRSLDTYYQNQAIEVDQLNGVWSFSFEVGDKFAQVHVIKSELI